MQTRTGSKLQVADFTEDLVGILLGMFIGIIDAPSQQFSIRPFSLNRERSLGADAQVRSRIESFRPFYMQFKRPSAYPADSKSRVITDRVGLGLPVAPRTLFFELRRKGPKHHDYQHNVLFKLNQRLNKWAGSSAAYVCPLFLDVDKYECLIRSTAHCMHWLTSQPGPLRYNSVPISTAQNKLCFNGVPMFMHHVSIPPHELVTNEKHRYSFDGRGGYVCFHSPSHVSTEQRTLADFIREAAGDIVSDDGYIHSGSAREVLRGLLSPDSSGEMLLQPERETGLTSDTEIFTGEDDIGCWLRFGDVLLTKYQIHQFAAVRWLGDSFNRNETTRSIRL